MALLLKLLKWAVTPIGGVLSAAAGVTVLVLSFAYSQQSIGARKVVAKQETQNAKARTAADAASRRSLDADARGVLNPFYRAD